MALTLDTILDKKEPVYVMNTSANPRGRVSVTAWRPDGSPYIIMFPKTWIPICVTDQCSHNTLRNSDDFRRQLTKGLIQLIDKTEAEQILSSPDAEEEQKRLNLSQYGTYGTSLPKNDIMNQVTRGMEKGDDVKISVKEILLRDVSNTEKYHLLRADESILSPEDFKYIVINGEGKVKEWAESHLG